MPQETDRLKLPLPLGNETVTRESINGIFEKIDAGVATKADLDALREAVSKMDIPDASLTQKGKVQLSDVINSNAKDKAATSSAVKLAFDEATSAKQLGVEQKARVVAALNSIGVSAATTESWIQLIQKLTAVIRATGNATAVQVLSGVTFSNASANGQTGTMPNRSAQSAHQLAKLTEVWQGDRAFFMPPDGYYDGNSWVYALTPDLKPDNLLIGKKVLGVAGTYNPIVVNTHSSRKDYITFPNSSLKYTDILGYKLPNNKRTVLTGVQPMNMRVSRGGNINITMGIALWDHSFSSGFRIHNIQGPLTINMDSWYRTQAIEIDLVNKRTRYVEAAVLGEWKSITEKNFDFDNVILIAYLFAGEGSPSAYGYFEMSESFSFSI
ncbi:phage tail protein [Paenibacillus polysaccharolyticus]|uniref:tail fiber protein n=1 Tax=Paenibacillus polysaccharolyticus TaxID=582692 RepID=UPI00209D1E2D|nr:tail fiber protein [Paenibacillus polysaccharolyticus]MCP1135531.1 phage tail protein [Paenibacillus polysaccharolyticus]